jgi:CRP-like cAMP-binding protein
MRTDRILRQSNGFQDIPADVLALLFHQKLAKDEIVFNEGDSPDAVFFLESGLMKTVKFMSHEGSSTIDFIIPGQMLGMIAVMDGKNYPVSAQAVRDSEIYRLPASLFQDFMNRFPGFRKEVFRQVGNHLRNSQILRTLMQEPVERRIAHILNYLLETMGPDIQLLREDIAAMAGCTESTAIRVIISFRKRKIIQTGWKKFKILSPEKLKALLT